MSIFNRQRSKPDVHPPPIDNVPRPVLLRIDGRQYTALPPVDRTSYIVGALDMMSQLIFYIYPQYKPNVVKLETYANFHPSNNLRILFDEFMAADPIRAEHSAASNFMVFLDEKAKAESSLSG